MIDISTLPLKVEGLDINEYHASDSPFVSSTFLRTLLSKSPAHAMYNKLNGGKKTKAFEIGNLIHTMILEPELVEARYGVYDGEFRTNEAKAMRADFESQGVTIIKTDVYEKASEASTAFKEHPFFKVAFGSGKAEVSLFAQDKGILLKSRPDWTNEEKGYLVDLKTTESASPVDLKKSVINYGYHVQACLAMRVYQMVYGKPCTDYIFAFLEKEPPYGVSFAVMDDELKTLGNAMLDKALTVYSACLESGKYPCYPNQLVKLEPDTWDWNNLES